jgi:peptide deformylase
MAILKIARMGHPVLKHRAEPVPEPITQEIQDLVRDMAETLQDIGGIGLAAPQVHVSKRVVIFFVPGGRRTGVGEPQEDIPLTVLINPEIEPLGEELAPGVEACLSVPGLAGQVARFTRIRYRALDLHGRMFEREASGYHARVVQHECDHLDGILYPMRMTDLSSLAFVEEMRRFGGEEVEEE